MISNELFKNVKLPDKKFTIVPDLVRWAKKNKLMDKDVQRLNIKLEEDEYAVPQKNKSRVKKINIKTGRLKKHNEKNYEVTKIKPEDRTLKNLPVYADKKPKVRFQDWSMLKNLLNFTKNMTIVVKFGDGHIVLSLVLRLEIKSLLTLVVIEKRSVDN